LKLFGGEYKDDVLPDSIVGLTDYRGENVRRCWTFDSRISDTDFQAEPAFAVEAIDCKPGFRAGIG
jgi:hypothetical protein